VPSAPIAAVALPTIGPVICAVALAGAPVTRPRSRGNCFGAFTVITTFDRSALPMVNPFAASALPIRTERRS
jgi:hypothetical protein